MIELVPVVIDTITASIGLADAVGGKKESRPKIKTQINNYHITVNQNHNAATESMERPRNSAKSRSGKPDNGDAWVLLLIAFVIIVAVMRFYCRWEQYINAVFSLTLLIASLSYQAITSKFVFDKKTQTRHMLIFLYPVLFRLLSLVVGHFISIDTTFEQYRAVYGDAFGASIQVWFNSTNPTSATMYVLGQLFFILSVWFGLVMLALEIYITCSDKKRPKWLTGLFRKYDISSRTTPLCFVFLLISLFVYPLLQKSA